jgi:hypothetical protein
MGRCRTALGVVLASLVLCAPTAEGRADGSGPVDLELADLEQLTGGAWQPTRPLFDRSAFQRSSFIQTSISMPIANAFAVCFMCSGDAMAVAIAGAIGSGRADSTSFASGRGEAFTSAFAAGPPFIFVFPDSFGSHDFQAMR